MQFLLFECKLILKHKLYLLYCMIVAALFVWTAGLFSIGENLEPLDETHVLVRTLLEDSGREQIVNGHLLDIAQICADSNERDFLWEHAYVEVSDAQRLAMQGIVQTVLDAIGDGSHTREQVLAWSTEIFQKQEIHLNAKEMDAILDSADGLLGGYTHFSEDCGYGNFRELCYEIGGYSEMFQVVEGFHKKDSGTRYLPLSEAVKRYEKDVEQTAYTGMFAPYLCDKMGIILCLAAAFVLAVFQLSLSAGMKDMLSLRAVSAARMTGTKYAGLVIMMFLPALLLMSAADIRICLLGMKFGYSVNPFTIPVFAVIWLLPEILFMSAAGMLLAFLFDFMAVPFLMGAVVFGISINDAVGEYGYSRVVLRYPRLGGWEILNGYVPDILSNRIFYVGMSVLVLGAAAYICYLQKMGLGFAASGRTQPLRKNLQAVWCEIKQELEGSYLHVRRTGAGKCRGIFYYQLLLGFGKGIVYCLVLDIGVSFLFNGDMTDLQIFRRFLPLNGLILFSAAGLAEREGNCADLVSMKDRVHVRTVQSVMAGILSAGFVLMVGVAMRQPLGVCLFVGACTVGLGCICSVVSKFACGIIGGMFVSIGVYICAVTACDFLIR